MTNTADSPDLDALRKDAARWEWFKMVAPCSVRERIAKIPDDDAMESALDAAMPSRLTR